MFFFYARFSIFSLQYPCKWYRMGLKVVKSGAKWFKVAEIFFSWQTTFEWRKRSVQSTCGQGDCGCSWENTITQSTQRAG